MSKIIYIGHTSDIINFITTDNTFQMSKLSSYHNFYKIDCDDEFLSLLKLKFGNDIRTWNEICKNPQFAYVYARHVIKGAFLDGEVAIATNAEMACWYAKYVIKRRFPAGENAIFRDNYHSIDYKSIFNIIP